jgi:hypothetical protein
MTGHSLAIRRIATGGCPSGGYARPCAERGIAARHFTRKIDAQTWLDAVTTAVHTGTYSDAKRGRVTVGEWAPRRLDGQAHLKPSTHESMRASSVSTYYRRGRRYGSLTSPTQMSSRGSLASLQRAPQPRCARSIGCSRFC